MEILLFCLFLSLNVIFFTLNVHFITCKLLYLNVKSNTFLCRMKFSHLLASYIGLLNFLQTDRTSFHWILTKLGVWVFCFFLKNRNKWYLLPIFIFVYMESKTCVLLLLFCSWKGFLNPCTCLLISYCKLVGQRREECASFVPDAHRQMRVIWLCCIWSSTLTKVFLVFCQFCLKRGFVQ